MNPLISIIVPVYNKVDAIDRCLQSVLTQTYTNWELLLIDDGSTDASDAICEKYADQDSRIHVFHKPNGGVSSARNMGLDNAKGDWITYIDADDYYEPTALYTLLSTALKYNTDIATANYQTKCQGKTSRVCCSYREHRVNNNFREWYFMSIKPGPGSVLIHHSALKTLRFQSHLCRYEDYQFLFTLLRSKTVAYHPSIVMTYAQDYSVASRLLKHPESDFIFHLNFRKKTFWEKMSLAVLLNEGLVFYSDYILFLRKKYASFLFYSYIDCKIRRLKGINKSISEFMSSQCLFR